MSALQRSIRLQQAVRCSSRSARPFSSSSWRPMQATANNSAAQPGSTNEAGRPATPSETTGIRTQEGVAESQPRHQPDYNVAVDYRTSAFSPIPTRVVDGSEPGEDLPAAVLSGAPVDLQARVVRIFRPAKTAMQSGTWHSHAWQMDWDPLGKGYRWENPLIGWQSSADFMQGERLSFKTKEDAVRFAEKQGYEYFVQEPNERRFVPKAYANNFLHSPKRLKKIPTK